MIEVGPPGRVFVPKNNQTSHIALELVENAILVNVHPPREPHVFLGLDLDVNQHPFFLA